MAKNKLEEVIEARRLEKATTQTHPMADDVLQFELGGRAPTEVPVDRITPSPLQHRKLFDPDALEDLAENIRSVGGLLEPILVRPSPSQDGFFELIAGERRWRAYQLLGKTHIPALMRPMSDAEVLLASIAENVQREDITDYERAVAVRRVQELNPKMSVSALARVIRRNRQDIYRYMAFFKLPKDVLEIVEDYPASFGASAAETLLAACDAGHTELAREAALRVVQGQLGQTRISAWLEARTRPNKRSHTRQTVLTPAGDPVGTLRRKDNVIEIRLDPNLDPGEVESALLAVLQTQKPSL